MREDAALHVPVVLEITSPVLKPLADDGYLLRSAEVALKEELMLLMRQLGVPGSPYVTAGYLAAAAEPKLPVRPFHLTVNGHRCRVPPEDIGRVIAYLRGAPRPSSEPLDVVAALRECESNGAYHETLVEFLRMACGQAVRRNLPLLLGDVQLEAYADELEEQLPRGGRRLNRGRLRRALGRMLALRISIADIPAVAEGMASAEDESLGAEELITRRRVPAIELHAPAEFLDELFTHPEVDVAEVMAEFREGLRDQLGLTVPEIRPLPIDDLKARCLRFKVNDVTGLPWVGLLPEQCMASAESASLELFDIRAEPAMHPAAGTGASVIAAEDRTKAEALGLHVYSPLEHALLCLAASLSAHAGCLIDLQWVQRALDSLADYSPALVDAARSELPPRRLVGLIRRLVTEGISIGNLPRVLDLLLEHQTEGSRWPVCAQSSATSLGEDEVAPEAEPYVRSGMPRSTLRRWRASTQTTELPAFVLTSELDDDSDRDLSEAEIDRFLDALQEEVEFVPAGSGMPVLITSSAARHGTRKLVAQEFPRIGVLSRLELPPETALRELGRLALREG